MKFFLFFIAYLSLVSCKETKEERINSLFREWNGREIVYPNNMHFTTLGKDTNYLFKKEYTIVTYVDSIGCTSCKLQLVQWRKLIAQLDSVKNTSVLFFLFPKDIKEMLYALKQSHFIHPVCIDEVDAFNKLNKLPPETMFHTFLLDKENKVVAIGNPVHNEKVRDLYLNIIGGEKSLVDKAAPQTTVSIFEIEIDMGRFNYLDEQQASFLLQNSGSDLLVINDAITSCGCTTVVYNKAPVKPGESVELKVIYKADHPEHFNKTITVYCNTASSPIKLEIKGNAE